MSALTMDLIAGVTHLVPSIVAMASDEGGALWLLAAGPAGALGTYWAIFRYYRNTDKSHHYERDTLIEAQPIQGSEKKVDHIRKTRDSSISGDNSSNHRARVRRAR